MGHRLLVVDSDRSFLKEHQLTLEAAFDVDVLAVPDGALAKLEAGQYAATLICVEVAENKGYALCSAIRKNPSTAALKVVLISAKATEEEYRRHQSLKGRADIYLHKPISPGALVAALSQVAPPRAVDPDNPLGDLTGDLGEEWLDSLKDELEGGPPPPAAAATIPPTRQTVAISLDMLRQAGISPQAPAPMSATAPIPVQRAEPVAQNQTVAISMEQLRESLAKPPAEKVPDPVPELEARIKELEGQIQTRADVLELAEAEIDRLTTELELSRTAEASATRNLDESERLSAELEQLRTRLKEREEALQRTREDYEALQRSHDSITQNLDDLERRQKEADELREKLLRAEEALARLEQSSVKEGEGNESLKNQLRQAIEEHHDLLQQVEQLNHQMAEKNQRVIGLLRERDRLQQQALEAETYQNRVTALERERQDLDSSLGGLRGQHEELRGQHEELGKNHQELGSRHEEAQRRVDDQTGRIQALETDLEGKEATLRAQGRDLAGLESRLQSLEGDAETLRARVAELEASLKAQDEAAGELQASKEKLLEIATDLERQLGKMVGRHEAERLELLGGLDEKEAELGRVQGILDANRQSTEALEVELRNLQSTLADRSDRLSALAALLAELGEKIQRGADLTKA
jgi:chromosome segregation ATPase/CheY-like chemotaxis protein